MKKVLVVAVVILILVAGLPLGMAGMGDCPMCTVPSSPFALGICLAVVSMGLLAFLLTATINCNQILTPRSALLTSSIYRPPRAV